MVSMKDVAFSGFVVWTSGSVLGCCTLSSFYSCSGGGREGEGEGVFTHQLLGFFCKYWQLAVMNVFCGSWSLENLLPFCIIYFRTYLLLCCWYSHKRTSLLWTLMRDITIMSNGLWTMCLNAFPFFSICSRWIFSFNKSLLRLSPTPFWYCVNLLRRLMHTGV